MRAKTWATLTLWTTSSTLSESEANLRAHFFEIVVSIFGILDLSLVSNWVFGLCSYSARLRLSINFTLSTRPLIFRPGVNVNTWTSINLKSTVATVSEARASVQVFRKRCKQLLCVRHQPDSGSPSYTHQHAPQAHLPWCLPTTAAKAMDSNNIHDMADDDREKRLPTFPEVLARKTRPPVDLFMF